MGMNPENFGDLATLTITNFKRKSYTNLITDRTDCPAAKQLIKKSRMEATDTAGLTFNFKVRMGTSNSYQHITASSPDVSGMTDDFVSATNNFRKIQTSYSFIEEFVDFNGGPLQIIDLVKAKEDGADADFIEGIETDFWAFTPATDTNGFRSLPYWCHKNATEGFNGGIPTGYDDVAGLSPTTWPRWNNYTFAFTNISLDDAIQKMREMAVKTFFKPSVPVPGLADSSNRRNYYTNYDNVQVFENVLDSRNDNLGTDVAKNDGMAMFRRAAIEYVPELDRDTTNPIYQIDWDSFKIMVKSKWWQKKTILKPYPGQRNQITVFKDTYMNFICLNRRNLGVGSTGVTYP